MLSPTKTGRNIQEEGWVETGRQGGDADGQENPEWMGRRSHS